MNVNTSTIATAYRPFEAEWHEIAPSQPVGSTGSRRRGRPPRRKGERQIDERSTIPFPQNS